SPAMTTEVGAHSGHRVEAEHAEDDADRAEDGGEHPPPERLGPARRAGPGGDRVQQPQHADVAGRQRRHPEPHPADDPADPQASDRPSTTTQPTTIPARAADGGAVTSLRLTQ